MNRIIFPLKLEDIDQIGNLQDCLQTLFEAGVIKLKGNQEKVTEAFALERRKKEFGASTKRLVREFQKARKLKVTGEVNVATVDALNEELERREAFHSKEREEDEKQKDDKEERKDDKEETPPVTGVSLMKVTLKPIALDESSFYVGLLHQALGALGVPVANPEVIAGKAGKDTLQKVRALQAHLKVPVNPSVLVDDATWRAIGKALWDRGLISASRSFKVTGSVKLPDGSVKKRQPLIAFDLDLRGVAIYKKVKNIAELKQNGGFELLGEAASDNLGKYSFTFYEWQYGKAERKKADVVVYALQGEEIIGRSRMVNSEDYSDTGLVRDLEVSIEQVDQRTEYAILMEKLNVFLQESETSLVEIAASVDQLAFTAGELDVDRSRLDIAAKAESLIKESGIQLSHELLYGIGRQGIRLVCSALYKKKDDEHRSAIAKSTEEKIIRQFKENEVDAFLQGLMGYATKCILNEKDSQNKNTLNAMLSNALPDEKLRLSFLNAMHDFTGEKIQEFWTTYLPSQPEFKDNPDLIANLLLTQQLSVLTGNHQTLVKELQVNRQVNSPHQLLDIQKDEWVEIIKKTGIPNFIEGENDEQKINKYADLMQTLLNAAFPTQRIARMIEKGELPIQNTKIAKHISTFLAKSEKFDFSNQRVHDFKYELKEVAGEDYDEVRFELMKIQRVYQMSPNPQVMSLLWKMGLHSSFKVATMPYNNFIRTYAESLGGEELAHAVHQRASYIAMRAEMTAMHLREYSHNPLPATVMEKNEYERSMAVIKKHMPNPTPSYVELFGSPDICECDHCSSVYGPVAYFVDLLHFLDTSFPNPDAPIEYTDDLTGETKFVTVYDVLVGNQDEEVGIKGRRPDLGNLLLTCENALTIIPYIDLANEVMEYFVAHDALTFVDGLTSDGDENIVTFPGYDTGEATQEELRANPQNFILDAYKILSNNHSEKRSVYPFTLPYHQPLDAIRTYGDHLKVSRYEAMKAMNPEPDASVTRTIEAESLGISQEEYFIFTGEVFDISATPAPVQTHEYFGYTGSGASPDDLENLSNVREFLKRSGIKYTDLVELVKTRFINPYQGTLDFLGKVIAYIREVNVLIGADTFYTRLEQIEAGTLDPADDADIVAALARYNSDYSSSEETTITTEKFAAWVVAHLPEFRQVITLYATDAECNLDQTQLKTLQKVYEDASASEGDPSTSGITEATWSKMHRFIRLWRKLGWSIHETDLMLAALGEDDITTETISKLSSVSLLKTVTKQPLNQLAVLWGDIDTYGDQSLYKKLFLNKAAQQIDEAFKPDAWGDYLWDETQTLAGHKSAILAAFRITEGDLNAIVQVATVIEDGNPRKLILESDDPENLDKLNLQNLSTIYRFVVLAKALKMQVTDVCQLITLFGPSPFSTWEFSGDDGRFINISPKDTLEFYNKTAATKSAGFKPPALEYIFQGTLPPDSRLGLDQNKILQTGKAIRAAFEAIEQEHPETPASPLTSEIITAKLSLTFQPSIVNRFMGIVENTALFETMTEANLDIVIPDETPLELSRKYTYSNGSGRMTFMGVMSDDEQSVLESLESRNPDLVRAAVEALFASPEAFISENFASVFDDLDETKRILLNHPAQTRPSSQEEKLDYVYQQFLPVLKTKLRRDAITPHIAALIGLSQEAAALLIADDVDNLISNLSIAGFSAAYFNAFNWDESGTDALIITTEAEIDFSWGDSAPREGVNADNFSVRWQAYIAAPASGKYTLMVGVEEADEIFKLYLDNALILENTASNTSLEWEVDLNASKLHLLTLEYANATGNAGVKLRWKTMTTAPEIVPAYVVYPATILDDFVKSAKLLHQAAKFVLGFKMSETELNYFIGEINFKELEAVNWKRINDYMVLRNSLPQSQALLTDVFALANTAEPAPTIGDLVEKLRLATGWDQTDLEFLVGEFGLSPDSFNNEIAIHQLYQVMQIVAKTGLTANTIAQWGALETNFDRLNITAQLLKNAVKAKYEEKDWLELAGNLSNELRERQQAALVSYLLALLADQGVQDADALFEYLLIDVQMSACMDTSRIVQATAAVQMFVNRCLLNLENNPAGDPMKVVLPSAIDKNLWEWMKNYRVWEANRKVFLYPENWLAPEWRKDRSEFFRELESYLVQNDITNRSVEQSLRDYLTSLNEVANLDVCGMHQENYENGNLKYLHVFARTHNTPYKYFYRKWDEFQKWSTWEKVQVDIRGVEDGENSGVHLVPVVWKNRLFLFWPEFMEKQEEAGYNKNQSIYDLGIGDTTVSELKPTKHWEIRLAWSEYVDGKWSPKQVSKEYLSAPTNDINVEVENIKSITIAIGIYDKPTQWLRIELWNKNYINFFGYFSLADIQSKIEVRYPTPEYFWETNELFDEYDFDFMKRYKNSAQLDLRGNTYLQNNITHRILERDNRIHGDTRGFDHTRFFFTYLEQPFFFSDTYRTYFVRPAGDVPTREYINNTVNFNSYDSLDYYGIDAGIVDPVQGMTSAEESSASRGIGLIPMSITSNPPVMPTSTGSANTNIQADAFSGGSTFLTLAGREIPQMQGAFGGVTDIDVLGSYVTRLVKGLEFHTFYHPFSSKFVTRLNQGGIPALMGSDTENPDVLGDDVIQSDEGITFDGYDPNWELVKRYWDFDTPPDLRTAYKENVCFDKYGANSLYNWELFFHAPFYIATRLSKNGKYKEAMKWFHYIFDPTTNEDPVSGDEHSRYWKVLPFKTTPSAELEAWFNEQDIDEWKKNPFDPHRVASNRPLAYMKNAVIKYVENLVAWGDSLFRQFTRENVYEALQLYVIANHVLGPRPEFIPRRGNIKAETYDHLRGKWDDFSNALVQLENIFPYSGEVRATDPATGGASLLGIGSALYFCIPANDELLQLWDTVADRLYKIRHCQDIEGNERYLALFAPPISPDALIQAMAQGLSLGSILADLSSPPPLYRFAYLIQKTNEFCGDVKALGSALLSALEKKEAEELGRLRASHETQLLELVTAVRERQVLDAKAYQESLLQSRKIAEFRFQHYMQLLGNEDVTVPPPPTLSATLTADSQLPVDTSIAVIETDVDESLVPSEERGVKLIPKEKEELVQTEIASDWEDVANWTDMAASISYYIPEYVTKFQPFGTGGEIAFGGQHVGPAISAVAKGAKAIAAMNTYDAVKAGKMASYIRRDQDWTLQANLAAKEINQLDKQIFSALIRIQVAEKELENHLKQIENAKEIELFLRDKFTNQELYQWMKEQLFTVYKQSYNLAYDMAKKAEKAYQIELGMETTSFIQYGYWDNSKQGLTAGENLQLALRQMEKSYLEDNRRELELIKNVSLARLNPLTLIELREMGKCYVSLPEELFDLDFRGHYFRRIKSVRLTIPCVVGPYTSVNCTLRLLNNSVRINTSIEDQYEHNNDNGLWIDDGRFRTNYTPVTAVATSTAQNDSGTFEFNFRDERYLPFELAGVISEWQLELSTEKELRSFDYSTISDVILQINYTAREGGDSFKNEAATHIKRFLTMSIAEQTEQPLMQIFSMRHEFPNEWHKFLHPGTVGTDQILEFTLGKGRFPFFVQDRDITIEEIDVFVKRSQPADGSSTLEYQMILSYNDADIVSVQLPMPQSSTYGGLNKITIGRNDAGLDLEELDIARQISLHVKNITASNEVEDVFMVFHYKLAK